jgi:hypothetical protein
MKPNESQAQKASPVRKAVLGFVFLYGVATMIVTFIAARTEHGDLSLWIVGNFLFFVLALAGAVLAARGETQAAIPLLGRGRGQGREELRARHVASSRWPTPT